MNRRVVFDTSTLVSAALRIDSPPHQALLKVIATCDLCASPETLAELERVLDRDKFDRYLDLAARREFALFLRAHSGLFAVDPDAAAAISTPCRDANDTQFLALAHVAEASVLISSDEHLLVLHPWNRVAIVTPAEFLSYALL